MAKIKILAIGQHEEILETLVRLINKNDDWEGQGANGAETAISLFDNEDFDLVLLSSGLSSNEEEKLRKAFTLHKPQIKIIQHFGGGSGLLTNEILSALANQNGNFDVDNQL